jgi:hypothetical protein
MRPTLKTLTLSLCALSLASCSDYFMESSSWWLRYHPEENEAVYVEIQDSVYTSDAGVDPLRKLVNGWRRYPPEGGLFAIDFDAEIDGGEAPEGIDLEEVKSVADSLREQVVVLEAGLYRFGTSNLGFFRVTKIKDMAAFLHGANYLLNTILNVEWRDGQLGSKLENLELSEETMDRWMERTEKREPWLTFAEKTFLLHVPMTEREATGFLREVIKEADDFHPDAWFMRALTGIRIAEEGLTLSFSPGGQRFESTESFEGDGDHSTVKGYDKLFEALQADPGFVEFDRAKLLERVK